MRLKRAFAYVIQRSQLALFCSHEVYTKFSDFKYRRRSNKSIFAYHNIWRTQWLLFWWNIEMTCHDSTRIS